MRPGSLAPEGDELTAIEVDDEIRHSTRGNQWSDRPVHRTQANSRQKCASRDLWYQVMPGWQSGKQVGRSQDFSEWHRCKVTSVLDGDNR